MNRYVEISPGVRVDTTPIEHLKPGDWIMRLGEDRGIRVADDGKSLKFRMPKKFCIGEDP